MKNFLKFQLLVIIVSTLHLSCSRENDSLDEVTEEEALEIVQASLMSDVYGLSIQAEDAAALNTTENTNSENSCGTLRTLDFTRSSLPNATIAYSYSIAYDFSLVCENAAPIAFAIDFDSNGIYDTPRLSSDDFIHYDAVLANIINDQTAYIYNGSFLREGTQTTRIAGRTKDFNSTLSIESTNVFIDKATRRILDGLSSFSLTGEVSTGNTFSYSGTVTYNGNGSATVVINGNTYQVQI